MVNGMIIIDTQDIIKHYLELYPSKDPVVIDYDWFTNLPEEGEFFKDTITNHPEKFLSDIRYVAQLKKNEEVTIVNHPVNRLITTIKQSSINKLISFDCVIRKSSEIKQEVYKCSFKCANCGAITEKVYLDSFDLKPPIGLKCPISEGHRKLIPILDNAEFEDTQYITAQEVQGIQGRQPKTIVCYLRNSLVDQVQAGTRCKITGIVKVLQMSNIDRRLSLYVEVLNITKDDDDINDVVISPEDIQLIKGYAESSDVYLRLAESVCPTIYGYMDIKLAIVLQMFGGTTIDIGSTYLRGSSHILLCGDPGLAKSQIIRAVANLVPRSVYTSGKSSSAAGLTAAAVKDELDGRWVLEAGALVLADGGMCIVDELDKMTDEDRSALHEAMESQTISVHKAGISAQLYTRCSLLAAANPKMGKFIPGVDLASQVNLPPALLSRFDLIFLMVDVPDTKMDSYVANFVLKIRKQGELAMENVSNNESTHEGYTTPIDESLIRKYICYARQINPILSEDVMKYLSDQYVKMRQDDDNISMTVRQLEALIRLCESSARVRLSQSIELQDADRALHLYSVAKKSISLNTVTNTSNFEKLPTKEETETINYIINALKSNNGEMDYSSLLDRIVTDLQLPNDMIFKILFDLADNKFISCDVNQNTKKKVIRLINTTSVKS